MNPVPKIFVVDDEPLISDTLAIILRRSGFEAESFTIPADALKAAALSHPWLLISDVFMPDLSGVDLAIAITQLCPNCKILLVSGQAETANLLQDSRKKGYDFTLLQRPIHPRELLAMIGTIES